MTMPTERTRALLFALDFLKEVLNKEKNPTIPDDIRRQAEVVLRHYPSKFEIRLIAEHESRHTQDTLGGNYLDPKEVDRYLKSS